jgi:hypothetical protein
MLFEEEIRKHRQQAERDAAWPEGNNTAIPDYFASRASLALWVIAEELFHLREFFENKEARHG